jgi:hypothetical protein
MADTIGMADIRGQNIDKAVKGFALQEFKLKQVCLVQSSSNWKETYYKETKTELTAAGNDFSVKGVGRLSAFPNLEPSWTQASSYHLKHAGEAVISWEDATTSAIDVMGRTLLRVARAVAYSVDNAIYDVITADGSVNTLAASDNWDSATVANRDPIGDILHGIEYITVDNYDVLANGYLLVNPENYTNIIMNAKVMQNPTFKAADVVKNGVVGGVCGLKIIVSNSVDADEACIIKGQEAVTYKEAAPLTTATIIDEGISYKIRAWEIGITQVTNPEAIHIITNTEL